MGAGKSGELEVGVFLPTVKNGFVYSSNATAYAPTYRSNLDITLRAEAMGLDYVFGMAKWRGFGGKTQLWDSSFESLSLIAALGAVTERIRLIATVTPVLVHPAVLAKMAATIDDATGGRLILNLVTGAILAEYAQMGILPDSYDAHRYEYAEEWLTVVKRLWTEPEVSHHGRYFGLDKCVSSPKPVQQPRPQLVCAASSEEGVRFTLRHAEYNFISDRRLDRLKERSIRVKEIAAEHGSTIKTAALVNLITGPTDQDAEEYRDWLLGGADLAALENAGNALQSQSRPDARARGAQRLADKTQIFFGAAVVGGPETAASTLADLVLSGSVDSLCLCFPEFNSGLELFGNSILPRLRDLLSS